jgi:HrpA-like RNA helicase
MRPLPVDRFADRIRECVWNSRVTLIMGQTGCGKSSRVPQLLQQVRG